MRKSVVIVLAIAIIGALAIYGKSHSASNANANTATLGASTTSQPQPAGNSSANTNSSNSPSKTYKDGTYTGQAEDTPYGTVQIAVVVSGGKITNINFLQMPGDLPHSQEVTAYSGPLLKQETIQIQSAQIDFVSGATSTSEAYTQSLQAALDQAA